MRRPGAPPRRSSLYVSVGEPQYDTYRALEVVPLLQEQATVGVIPTDTSYAFVTDLYDRRGVEKIYTLKAANGTRKPLSLLCKDLATIQKFTMGIDKRIFKMLRAALPGPYTFILPASNEVPRVVLEHKVHRKVWKRREVGVRIPNDPYCRAILDELDGPLLCSSVPMDGEDSLTLACEAAEINDNWCQQVDFVVDAGVRRTSLSTVVDLTKEPAQVLRQGEGDVDVVADLL